MITRAQQEIVDAVNALLSPGHRGDNLKSIDLAVVGGKAEAAAQVTYYVLVLGQGCQRMNPLREDAETLALARIVR